METPIPFILPSPLQGEGRGGGRIREEERQRPPRRPRLWMNLADKRDGKHARDRDRIGTQGAPLPTRRSPELRNLIVMEIFSCILCAFSA